MVIKVAWVWAPFSLPLVYLYSGTHRSESPLPGIVVRCNLLIIQEDEQFFPVAPQSLLQPPVFSFSHTRSRQSAGRLRIFVFIFRF